MCSWPCWEDDRRLVWSAVSQWVLSKLISSDLCQTLIHLMGFTSWRQKGTESWTRHKFCHSAVQCSQKMISPIKFMQDDMPGKLFPSVLCVTSGSVAAWEVKMKPFRPLDPDSLNVGFSKGVSNALWLTLVLMSCCELSVYCMCVWSMVHPSACFFFLSQLHSFRMGKCNLIQINPCVEDSSWAWVN